jgi:hypothetical protein
MESSVTDSRKVLAGAVGRFTGHAGMIVVLAVVDRSRDPCTPNRAARH